MSFFASKKILHHIRINRSLSSYNVRKLLLHLRTIRPQNTDALAISIQAGAGDFVQTKLAIEAIDEISKKKMIPVYTFAEDFAIDTGYLLLACGNEVAANPFSIIGDIGRSVKIIAITNLLEKFGLEPKTFSSDDEQGSPFRWWREQTSKEADFVQHMLESETNEFISIFKEKRGLALDNAQLKEDELNDILNGGFYSSVEACKLGLVDKIETFEEFQLKNFPNHKLEEFKTDQEDDFDFDVLELTAANLPGLISSFRSENTDLSNFESSLSIPGQNKLSKILDVLSPEDIELLTNEVSHRILQSSLKL